MRKITEGLISWASVIDEATLAQANTAAEMPFVHPHLALMPDAHLGLGATVGSVIPTRGVVMPAAVGVDIGCGMAAVRTQLTVADLPDDRRALRLGIERDVPVDLGGRNARVFAEHTQQRIDELRDLARRTGAPVDGYAKSWPMQLGTLGSGNHFIEICADEEERIWVFLHSGSRGIGNLIARHHIDIARRLCAERGVELPDRDLAYLTEGEPEFDAYLRDLRWAQHFAALNRAEMMDRILARLGRWAGVEIERTDEVNCHHNYTEPEEHFGERVWVSRKGAINAEDGRRGLIPGSMGTRSYVVEGLGNPESLNSAPHGAGRAYSRRAARRTFSRDDLRAAMGDIEYHDSSAFVDEIPAAYKDVDQVMADAEGLVRVVHTLRQLVNVKGT
ncbi:RtcB family protein [Enemella sp. A6]|uniref:RtcB family protein n=1 Tax=Enemella sp. A6 TaxID=3440152 RepID=UPI003EBAAC8D